MDALDKRVIELLDAFEARNSVSLKAFKRTWKRERFSEIHFIIEEFSHRLGQPRSAIEASRRFLLRELFRALQRLLIVPGFQLAHRIGAIYSLWVAYETQTLQPPERIAIAPNVLQAALATCTYVRQRHPPLGGKENEKKTDIDMVMSALLLNNCFRFSLSQSWLEEMTVLRKKEKALPPIPSISESQTFMAMELDDANLDLTEVERSELKELQVKHRMQRKKLETLRTSWFNILDPKSISSLKYSFLKQSSQPSMFLQLGETVKSNPWQPRYGPRRPIPRPKNIQKDLGSSNHYSTSKIRQLTLASQEISTNQKERAPLNTATSTTEEKLNEHVDMNTKVIENSLGRSETDSKDIQRHKEEMRENQNSTESDLSDNDSAEAFLDSLLRNKTDKFQIPEEMLATASSTLLEQFSCSSKTLKTPSLPKRNRDVSTRVDNSHPKQNNDTPAQVDDSDVTRSKKKKIFTS